MLNPELYKMKVEDVMTKVEWTVGPNDPISEALGKMKRYNTVEIPVVEGERLKGFIKLRTLAKRRKIPLQTQTRHFMVAPPKVKPKERISQTAEKLISRDYSSLPVTINSLLKGLISRRDIIRGMVADVSLSSMPVESIMNFAPLTVDPTDSVFKALAQMELEGESSAAVVDDRERYLGMVTSTRLATMMELPPKRQHKGSMGEKVHRNRDVGSMAFMTEGLQRNASVLDAANLLLKLKVPVVYVLDGTELAGSVSEVDVLEVLLRGPARRGPLVQIAGMDDASLMDASEMDDLIRRSLSRIEKISEVKAVTVRVKHHHYSRDEDKFTVNVKVTLPTEVIAREGYDFELGSAIEEAFSAVEKHVRKSHDKRVR